MSEQGMGRRGILKLFGSVPLAAGFAVTEARAQTAREHTRRTAGKDKAAPFAPRFFNAHEWTSVRVLADLVIPADERSGSASDARVPEFMDFVLTDPLSEPRERERNQTAMRGGLAWLDLECGERFGRTFVECTDAERRALLDDIAWPERTRPELSQGAAFFCAFRDLTASGFWSSRMGVEDLRYMGNTVVPDWQGCPPEVLEKIGLGEE